MKLLILFIFLISGVAIAEESCTKDVLKKNGFASDFKLVTQAVLEHTMLMGESKVQYDGYFAVNDNCQIAYISNDKKTSKILSGRLVNCTWMEAAKSMMSLQEGNPPKSAAMGKTVCNSLPK